MNQSFANETQTDEFRIVNNLIVYNLVINYLN